MKFALISTPRSGNTWLRYLLAGLYGLDQHAVHTPQALEWANLSDNCIVQLHWHRLPAFETLLAEHHFSPVTIARHPVAVLLSIWQFAAHEPATAQWLSGEGGDETSLLNQTVDSAAFLKYACSPRAKALMSVSAEWWDAPGVVKVRYEDLVQRPYETLTTLCQGLGPVLRSDIGKALQDNSMDKLRQTSTNNHFWQGKPDTWQQMVSSECVQAIEQAHSNVFESLGYPCLRAA